MKQVMAERLSAPAFKTTMEEALRLLGVPRDLPAELEEKKTPGQDKDNKTGDDDLAIADLAEGPSMQDLRQALGDPSADGAVPVIPVNAVSGPKAPKLHRQDSKGRCAGSR